MGKQFIIFGSIIGRGRWWFAVPVGLLAFGLAVAWPSAVYAGPAADVQIKVRAKNQASGDKPFCGVDLDETGGLVGDKLDVNVSMDATNVVTGTARFEDADGNVTTLAGSKKRGSRDGTGIGARFEVPFAVAVGSDRRVYVAEFVQKGQTRLYRIRVIREGEVTTLATVDSK